MIKRMVGLSKEERITWIHFERRFGLAGGYDECCGGSSYSCKKTGESYMFPDQNMTTKELFALIKKSLDDNHDYVFDLVKDYKYEIIPGVYY